MERKVRFDHSRVNWEVMRTLEACKVRRRTLVVWSCAATSSRDFGRLDEVSQIQS